MKNKKCRLDKLKPSLQGEKLDKVKSSLIFCEMIAPLYYCRLGIKITDTCQLMHCHFTPLS